MIAAESPATSTITAAIQTAGRPPAGGCDIWPPGVSPSTEDTPERERTELGSMPDELTSPDMIGFEFGPDWSFRQLTSSWTRTFSRPSRNSRPRSFTQAATSVGDAGVTVSTSASISSAFGQMSAR